MASTLDALAEEFENSRSSACTLCAFIESQPNPDEWDALMAGPRKHSTLHRLLRNRFGWTASADPISRHRNLGHRKP